MASPQIENGYTKIANELIEALVGFNMSGQGFQVTLFMIRKTYGFNKIEDFISLSQIMEATGLSKIRASQVVNRLQLMKILTVTQNINGIGKKYKINKDFETWVTVNEKCNRYTKVKQTVKVLRNRPLRKSVTTKETITKETIQKKRKMPIPDNFTISNRVKKWAQVKGFTKLEAHLESFKLSCAARGYEYIDWDSAFMKAITDDWAKIRQGGTNGNNRKFTSEKPISRQDREQADEAERINREYREAKAREAAGKAS